MGFLGLPCFRRRTVNEAAFVMGLLRYFGGCFSYSRIWEAQGSSGFFEAIRFYQIIGGQLAGWVVWLLISVEIVGGCALFVRSLHKGAILVFASLLVLFTLSGVSAKLRGAEIPCGCFSAIEQATPLAGPRFCETLCS